MLNRTFFFILTLTFISLEAKDTNEIESSKKRNERVFSLFSVVTFPNDQCTGSSSTTNTPVFGTCFSTSECTDKSGTADGNCASGFGVCCTFLATTCGTQVRHNCTYIQNPGYPSSYSTAGACKYEVYPASADICQLRLDLDVFDITDATAANTFGQCDLDTFTMTSGSGANMYTLCGTLTGQHIYIETGRTTTAHTLEFTINAASTVGQWRMKVNQIECYSTTKAPSDCLQYHTGISGQISSFNRPVSILTGMAYSVCIRREYGYCAIDYKQATGTTVDSFQLGLAAETTAENNGDDSMATNYLGIHGSRCGQYSGGVFVNDCTSIAANQDIAPGTVRAIAPFVIDVNTAVTGAIAAAAITDNLGFVLVYDQVPCGAIGPIGVSHTTP